MMNRLMGKHYADILVTPGHVGRWVLLILLVVLVGGGWGIRGVIIAGLGTGVLLSGLKLQIPPLRAEILLLVVFIVILKLRGTRFRETARV